MWVLCVRMMSLEGAFGVWSQSGRERRGERTRRGEERGEEEGSTVNLDRGGEEEMELGGERMRGEFTLGEEIRRGQGSRRGD